MFAPSRAAVSPVVSPPAPDTIIRDGVNRRRPDFGLTMRPLRSAGPTRVGGYTCSGVRNRRDGRQAGPWTARRTPRACSDRSWDLSEPRPRARAPAQGRRGARGGPRLRATAAARRSSGERIHRFGARELVCELCRPRRRDAPERSELVQHAEHGQTVRPAARPDAPPRARDPPGAGVDSGRRGRPSPSRSTIARPREEVFAYLADIANHAEFLDHFLVDWHLTREDTFGCGAGARFRVKAPLQPLPVGRHARSSRSSAPRADRRGRADGQVQPHPHARRLRARPGRRRRDPRALHAADRAQDGDRPLAWRPRAARLGAAQAAQGRAPPALDPRGGRGRGRRPDASPAARASRASRFHFDPSFRPNL